MFALHESRSGDPSVLATSHARSDAALNAATNIVVDIAVSHGSDTGSNLVERLPPSGIYIAQAALRHISRKNERSQTDVLDERALNTFFQAFKHRWKGVESVGALR